MGADDLSVDDFKGAKWLLLSGYCCYGGNLLQRAVDLAAQAGVKVALDLASFEIVQSFKPELRKILEARQVHCCFCNEVLYLSALQGFLSIQAYLCNRLQLAKYFGCSMQVHEQSSLQQSDNRPC